MTPTWSPKCLSSPPKSLNFGFDFPIALGLDFSRFSTPLKPEKPQFSLRGLLRIEGRTFPSGAPFWLQIHPFWNHFGSKIDVQIDQKRLLKLYGKKAPKMIPKWAQNDHEWLPGGALGSLFGIKSTDTSGVFLFWAPKRPPGCQKCPPGCPK